jgi:hypothetical protein
MRGLFLLCLAPSLVACQSLTGLSDLQFGEGAAQAGATRSLMLRAGETLFLIERVML